MTGILLSQKYHGVQWGLVYDIIFDMYVIIFVERFGYLFEVCRSCIVILPITIEVSLEKDVISHVTHLIYIASHALVLCETVNKIDIESFKCEC